MTIPRAYKNDPNAPWRDNEPEQEPDPDAVYEREIEKQIEREQRIREEAEAVCGDSDE
jgi:hypothetical protein